MFFIHYGIQTSVQIHSQLHFILYLHWIHDFKNQHLYFECSNNFWCFGLMFQRANVGADVRYTGERPSWIEADTLPRYC